MRRAVLSLLALWIIAAGGHAQTSSAAALGEARAYLEAEQPLAALQILHPLEELEPPSAEAFLLLSTAHFMLGDLEEGRAALDRSIEIDPTLRQAWLNRAGLDLAEQRYDDAIAAFSRAQQLDPQAPDNEINLGATMILKGDPANASHHFNRYLMANRSSADAYYLVATNYAMGGHGELAFKHLEAAVKLDEKSRRRSRTDPNFAGLSEYPPFQVLLASDHYQLPAGSHFRREAFDQAYDGGHSPLLTALLNALQFSGKPFDPNVEVTDEWALVWADARMKVSNAPEGGGQVEFSAPGSRLSPVQWTRLTDELVGQIKEQLALLSMKRK